MEAEAEVGEVDGATATATAAAASANSIATQLLGGVPVASQQRQREAAATDVTTPSSATAREGKTANQTAPNETGKKLHAVASLLQIGSVAKKNLAFSGESSLCT